MLRKCNQLKLFNNYVNLTYYQQKEKIFLKTKLHIAQQHLITKEEVKITKKQEQHF